MQYSLVPVHYQLEAFAGEKKVQEFVKNQEVNPNSFASSVYAFFRASISA
jgi:hypothetical protein